MDLRTWGTVWAFLFLVAGGSAQTEEEEDEKRPYKFAFNIEGYQHRSEEKDERGIIKGEYGFVTGDGVYHVTVYATDENGDFKILSMKNYYIGLPGQETTTAVVTPPSPRPRVTTPPSTTSYTTTISPIIQHLNGLMGCSGCIIPERNTTKLASTPPQSEIGDDIDIRVGDTDESPGLSPGLSKRPDKPNTVDKSYMGVEYVPFNEAGVSSTTPCSDCGITSALRPSSGLPGKSPTRVNSPSRAKEFDQHSPPPGQAGFQPPPTGQFGQPPSSVSSVGPTSDSPSGQGQSTPEDPNFQFPDDKSVPEVFQEIYSARPDRPHSLAGDERLTGPPDQKPAYELADPQLVAQELFDKFYQFHYILSYNGHNETGYRNGDKEGDYFVNGRDGLGRNVKYVANEFGYQPSITLVNLGLESPDVPKEQDEQPNELKSSDFRWFYKR